MPRRPRMRSDSGVYHTMLRGIDKRELFLDDEDHTHFLESLNAAAAPAAGVQREGNETKSVPEPVKLYAWCLMGNHVHLLLKAEVAALPVFFKRLGVRYSAYFNKKYERTGHLFQDRYRSEAVNDERYFLAVLRYIYNNPVKAGLCEDIAEYPWSSFGRLKPDESWPLLEQFAPTASGFDDETEAFLRRESDDESGILEMEKRRPSDKEAAVILCAAGGVVRAMDLAGLSQERQQAAVRKAYRQDVSIRQIARLSGITKGMIERYLKA